MRSLQAVVVAVVLVAAIAATLPAGTGAVWVPIPAGDLNSLLVQQVARFAVLLHDLSRHANLVLVKVERGAIERSGAGGVGTTYRLDLTAESSPGGSRWLYRCELRGVPASISATWKLLSFKAI
ncbi:hypothetical protein ACQ4PT_013783 [Festuca glaucescens]